MSCLLAWGANRRLSGQAGIHPYPSAPARATAFSGGEAHRVKNAKELGRCVTGGTLNLLNEPTTSLLYMVDTARLLVVLGPLVDSGITVGIVEHNLELIKTANWVIDLEPDGGVAGGRVIAEGNPD